MEIDNELNSYIDKYRTYDLEFINSVKGDKSKYVFGTTPFSTFEKIVSGIKKPKRFIVLGSSIGFQCFYWNRLFPDIPAIGYEIHDVRYDFSVYLAEKYNLKNIELYNYDLINCNIQDGDLIWQNNLCMDREVCNQFNLMALKKEVVVVSYIPILLNYSIGVDIMVPGNFEPKVFLRRSLNLPTSWTEYQSFYIYENK
jgi:hypothetical protein